MKSKTSFFNGSLYVRNLMRVWPVWAFATFLMLLIPFSTIMMGRMNVYESGLYSNPGVTATLNSNIRMAASTVPIMAFAYAIVCAVFIWNYLYTPKSVGMFHSLPITRTGLFVTNVCVGLSMMMIPFTVGFAFDGIAHAILGNFSFAGMMIVWGTSLAESLFFFGFATLMAFFTGNIVALPLLYMFFNFMGLVYQVLLDIVADGLLYGVETTAGVLDYLSPLYVFFKVVDVKMISDGGPVYSYTIQNGFIIPLSAIVGLVMLALAYCLYLRRRSEVAGDLLSLKPLRAIMLALVTVGFTLGMGTIIYEIYGYRGDLYNAFPYTICLIVACTVGYYLSRMVLDGTVRVFNKKYNLGFFVAVLVIIAFVYSFELDVFGIEKKIPDINAIALVEMDGSFTNGNDLIFEVGKDDAEIKDIITLHREAINNKKKYTDTLANVDYYSSYERVHIVYTLKNGVTLERAYLIPQTRNVISNPDSPEMLIEKIANCRKAKLSRLGIIEDGLFVVGEITSHAGLYESFSTTQGNRIIEALIKDVDEDRIENYSFSEREDLEYYVLYIDMETTDAEGTRKEYAYFTLNSNMINTLNTLMELGLIEEKDLILESDYYNYEESIYEEVTEEYIY